jgi:deoxyribodipyrimidine photo-lyase
MQTPKHLLHNPPMRQLGGRSIALATLHNFLNARSIGYRGGISSPLSAPDACSRISAYLTYGSISMREVVQATRKHLELLPPQASRHRAGLSAFISRLYWHCHFIQKLESEPAIEWRNMHRGYDNLREQDFNQEHFDALKDGRTGWPMVDACVNMLRETGWLNFRMRAMLVSVAAYPLWLHWRPVGEWLATQFLDYEPGIHWSQLQMQSGTTGIKRELPNYRLAISPPSYKWHGKIELRLKPYENALELVSLMSSKSCAQNSNLILLSFGARE